MNSASHHHHGMRASFGFSVFSGSRSSSSARVRPISDGRLSLQVQVQVGLADRHVVGIRQAVAQLAVEVLGHLEHRVAVLRVAGGFGGGHEAGIHHARGPDAVEMRLRTRQLPVGDLAQRLVDRRRLQRRATGRSPSGPASSRRVAEVAAGVLVDDGLLAGVGSG